MEADSSEMADEPQAWYLKSKFPVFWPECDALTLPQDEFEAYLVRIMEHGLKDASKVKDNETAADDNDTFTLVSGQLSTADITQLLGGMEVDTDVSISMDNAMASDTDNNAGGTTTPGHPFMTALHSFDPSAPPSNFDPSNKILTENGDIAYRSTTSALLDLFTELEDVVSGPRLLELLNGAWAEDPLSTLKLIFNARSIHLGKSSRHTFYRCAGWLATYHPLTLVANLQWLSRPIIEKKAKKEGDDHDADFVVVEDENDPARYDVKHGVAHGYWKDLLNILALSARRHLSVLDNPRDILNIEDEEAGKSHRSKKDKREDQLTRHTAAITSFTSRPIHHALHLTTARLFATQLTTDLSLLHTPVPNQSISLCAKWAPSPARFHDKTTTIATTIAELLFPPSHFPPTISTAPRETYLRHARESYRRALTTLRQDLDVVERHITTATYPAISYPKVPSLAMRQHAPLFAANDPARFAAYLTGVASGRAKISGAVVLPSVLVRDALAASTAPRVPLGTAKKRAFHRGRRTKGRAAGAAAAARAGLNSVTAGLTGQVLDAQWATLVQRVRDAGRLESCIAVVDVSASMFSPVFADGTAPIHTAIGLGLVMAEVVRPPFGGSFITFSARPMVERIDLTGGLREKVAAMHGASWQVNTDLVRVFEELLLPIAVENGLRREEMVGRVVVFSDMQFDQGVGTGRWEGSYERIEKKYKAAGYEMPEVVFWNLAGGKGEGGAPKPVTAEMKGVAMVSGYSQGMLRVFMDDGGFGEEEEVVEDVDLGVDGVEVVKKRKELDPVGLMMRAIGHAAYGMLRVVD